MNTSQETTIIEDTQVDGIIHTAEDLSSLTQKIQNNSNILKKIEIYNRSKTQFPIALIDNLIQGISSCQSLEVLILMDFKEVLGQSIISLVQHSLSLPHLHTLDLTRTYLGSKGAEVLSKLLAKHTTLKSLSLFDAAILPDSGGQYQICEALRYNTTLQSLHLSRNPISQTTGHYLELAIRKNKRSQLNELYFHYPETEVESEQLYRDRMEKTFWDNSEIGRMKLKQLIKSADEVVDQAKHPETRDWYVNYNEWTHAIEKVCVNVTFRIFLKISSLEDFTNAVQRIAKYKSLDILLYADAKLIIPKLLIHDFIHALKECQNCHSLALRHFDNAFGEDIYYLISALSNLPVLTKLDVSYTLLGKLGYEALGTWIENVPPLKKLNITHSGLYAMQSYELLANALMVNYTLYKLKISHNFIDDMRCELLKSSLVGRNILITFEPEKSWSDYLTLLNNFITLLPWEQKKRTWDRRDGDPNEIKIVVEKKFSTLSFQRFYEATCQASFNLQAALTEIVVARSPDPYSKKLSDKLEKRFQFFTSTRPKRSNGKKRETRDDMTVNWTLFYDENSPLIKSSQRVTYGSTIVANL